MTREIVSVDEDETVRSVAGIMGRERVGSVIVTRNKKPAGIFTERDLLSTFIVQSRSLEYAGRGSILITPENESCPVSASMKQQRSWLHSISGGFPS